MIAKRNLLLPAFLLALAGVYSAAFYVSGTLIFEANPEILAAAVTFDLTLFVPLVYYFLLVRSKTAPAYTLIPVFLASLFAASYIIPPPHQAMLNLVMWLIVPVELIAASFGVYKIYLLKKHFSAAGTQTEDVLELCQGAAREIVGANFMAKIMAFELAMIYFAVFSWRKKINFDSRKSFSYHQNSGLEAITFGFVFLLIVETVVVHFLVAQWSAAAAWILTAGSFYVVLWLLADYQAVKLRPLEISDDALNFRLGLRWTLRIPFDAIKSFGTSKPQNPDYLKAVLEEEPDCFIELKEIRKAEGFYGISKKVGAIGFTVDERESFAKVLEQKIKDAL